jgi:hypothetical protein
MFAIMDDRAATQKFETLLSPETHQYLKDLVIRGTHGTSVPAVGRALIEEGIRMAIREGFLKLRDQPRQPH